MDDQPVKYPAEILARMRVVARINGGYALELAPNRFLHWLEPVTNRPCLIGRADMVMRPYRTRDEAEEILTILREMWTE